jgi:type II secretory pathway component PulF
MNHEQLAFFNQQLAAMLKSGLPLEGSLKQLSASMRHGKLRDEITRLEADLEQGTPLEEALGRRKLPELYVAMLRAGIKSNDLPGVLTLAADYYGTLHTTWLRLKGLMVYPGIVLFTSLLVSAFVAIIFTHMVGDSRAILGFLPSLELISDTGGELLPRSARVGGLVIQVWLPVIFLGLTMLAFLLLLSIQSWRNAARWKIPGFREASLSRLASTLATMLEHGADLDAALDVAQKNESHAGARLELAQWRQRLANGARSFTDIAQPGRLVPSLFVWLVTGAGENWARGFRRAAELYDGRSKYRTELALYAALPVTIILLAAIIGLEMIPLMKGFARFMGMFNETIGE